MAHPQLAAASLAAQANPGLARLPQFASHPNLSTALLQQQAQMRALQQAQLAAAQLQQQQMQHGALPANAFDASRSQGLLSSLGQVSGILLLQPA